jgi:hypothetical protein
MDNASILLPSLIYTPLIFLFFNSRLVRFPATPACHFFYSFQVIVWFCFSMAGIGALMLIKRVMRYFSCIKEPPGFQVKAGGKKFYGIIYGNYFSQGVTNHLRQFSFLLPKIS